MFAFVCFLCDANSDWKMRRCTIWFCVFLCCLLLFLSVSVSCDNGGDGASGKMEEKVQNVDKMIGSLIGDRIRSHRKTRSYPCYFYTCGGCGQLCRNNINTAVQQPPPVTPARTSIYQGSGRDWRGPRRGCNCSLKGSELKTCNIVSGQCRCKANYMGLTCDRCREGYYEDSVGCRPCECDPEGSTSTNCNLQSGECSCKAGVEGPLCKQCKSGFYGFSKDGCKECEPCTKRGHICDQETGRCSCPPHSHGEFCDHCKPNHWGYEPNVGCKACNCSDTGAIRAQCDLHTGSCICQQGYTGDKCDKCAHGYYGYPKCRRCSCHYPGTDILGGKCDAVGVCQCDPNGYCPCKSNVVGRRCNQCLEGTFGLHLENQEGCTECFCFGRSKTCTEAGYTWSKIRMKTRMFSVDFIDHRAIQLRSPLFLDTNNFQEIEGTTGNVTSPHGHFDIPLYWRLPEQFTGDRILSYGGYLRFFTITLSTSAYHGDFTQYPIARIEGNGIKLIHYSNMVIGDRYEIRLHESNWRLEEVHGQKEQMLPITRDVLMVVLQRVTGIFIKASDYRNFESVAIMDVALDSGVHLLGSPPPLAMGVEKCTCPLEYNGTSCQNPSLGNHRAPAQPTGYIYHGPEDIDNVIGKSQTCSCQGRSKVCDIETGHCYNCSENTSGPSCEKCAEGHYGDPSTSCQACACPSVTQNFAISCVPNPRANHVICKCKPGYYGPTCDRCGPGYYGQPHLPGGSCKPCNCNVHGSKSTECDKITGDCVCKPSMVGQKCSECMEARHILENKVCVLCDDCVQILLDRVDGLRYSLAQNTGHLNNGTLQPPWGMLEKIESRYLNLSEKVDTYLNGKETLVDIIDNKDTEILENKIAALTEEFSKVRDYSKSVQNATRKNKKRSDALLGNISDTKEKLHDIRDTLSAFATGQVSTKKALKEGQKLYSDIKKKRTSLNKTRVETDKVREQCQNVMRRVNELVNSTQISDFKDLKEQVERLNNCAKNCSNFLDDLHRTNEVGRLRNNENKQHLQTLKDLYVSIHDKVEQQKKQIEFQVNQVNKAKNQLNSSLITDYNEINELLDQLDDRISDDFVNTLPEKRLQLEKHVKQLEKTAEDYQRQFNKYDDQLKSLNSSGKFKESNLDMIKYARETYEGAQKDFSELQAKYLDPLDNDTLFDKSAISQAASERLQKRINAITNWFDSNITQPHKRLENNINDLKQSNWDNGLANNNASEQIHQMTFNKAEKLKQMQGIEDVIHRAVGSLEESRQIHKVATDLNITKKYNLDKSWEKFLELTSVENINKFKDNILFTKDLLHNVSNYGKTATHVDVLNKHKNILDQFNDKRAGINKKLEQLRNNIEKAKQIASMIPIPLNGGDCGRRFKVKSLEPSTKFSLSMEFKVVTLETPKNILRLHSGNDGEDFVKVATTDSSLHIVFDELDFKIPLEIDNENFIKLVLNETGATITRGTTLLKHKPNTSKKIKLYGISSQDWLELGWGGGRTDYGLPGCIKELTINQKQIGLWDFAESHGTCTSCKVFTKTLTKQTYRFNGDGYIHFQKLESSDRSKIDMYFTMNTFDENAMIFLVLSQGAYVAITLQNGHVRFRMQYKPEVEDTVDNPVDFISKKKYNNGKDVTFTFAKVYNKRVDAILFKVNEEKYERDIHVIPKGLIRILEGNFTIGGLPPNFYGVGLPDDFERTSFLGLLSATLVKTHLSLERNAHYGVAPVDPLSRFEFDRVLLNSTDAFVRFQKVLKVQDGIDRNIAFVVRIQKDVLNGNILQINENINFKLNNGILQLLMIGKEEINSTHTITDDNYHLVRADNEGCLYIDNKLQNEKKCPLMHFTLYHIKVEIGGKDSIRGVVKEVHVNFERMFITPDTYKDHQGAMIGRTLSLPERQLERSPRVEDKIIDISMKDISPPAMCERVQYDFEPSAYKFGDSQNSFIGHDVKNGFWKGNYTIEFELRTFYADGLLYLAHGNDHYNMFVIREGLSELQMKGKKLKKIETSVRVDDGKWHRIVVENHHSMQKKKRRLSLTIDGVRLERKMPQNRVANKLFFGNIPREYSSNFLVQQFRGCLRSLKINHMSPNFFDRKKTRRNEIGQCFSNIERGSYFRGDSYATYDRQFRLNNYLDIAFEFRTDQQNGILLSVADQTNRPALSIELQNGAVVMSVDMGNGEVTNVTNSLVSCNNKWHKVIASFTTELSINVDGVAQTWVLNGLEEMRSIEAPLYIGGLPDSAPGGTLKIRENLKGCIRSLSIDNKHVDWVNMHELKHVSLNSCPVTA